MNPSNENRRSLYLPEAIRNVILACAIGAVSIPAIYTAAGPDVANFVEPIKSGKLSRLDVAALERGYYEDLVRVNNFNSELWKIYQKRPADWLLARASGLSLHTGDFRQKALIPSAAATTPFSRITTNRWGMRDQDYEKTPPPGTFRFVLLGASAEMGWGVADGETAEAVLERRLNEEWTNETVKRFEILNMAVAGYSPLQQMATLNDAMEFDPHAVIYTLHGLEMTRAGDYLGEVVRKSVPNPYPYLRELADRADLDADTEFTVARKKLSPHREELTRWIYKQVVETCRKAGVLPILVYVPQTNAVGLAHRELEESFRIAKEVGFVTISLAGYLEGVDPTTIRLSEWDAHPNALGHRIIADRFYQELSAIRDRLPSPQSPTAPK